MKRQYQILVLAILALSVLCISCSDLKRNTSAPTSSVSENYSPYTCNACHGNATNAAPPKDLEGNTSTSSPGVGAHQAHLLAGHSVGATVACNECHVVPSIYNAAGHLDLTPGAEVFFQGTLSTTAFAHNFGADTASKYSPSTFTCTNTYCHGYFPNGNKQAPTWTDNTGKYRACGSCHGDITASSIGQLALPKTKLNGGTHLSVQDNPNILQCYRCHPSTIDTNYNLNLSNHINGHIDF